MDTIHRKLNKKQDILRKHKQTTNNTEKNMHFPFKTNKPNQHNIN